MVFDIYNCPCKKNIQPSHAKHYTCNAHCDAQNVEHQLLQLMAPHMQHFTFWAAAVFCRSH